MAELHYGELIDPVIENISLNPEVIDTEVKARGKAKVYYLINTYPSREDASKALELYK